ncbi:threonine/serine ThrE exporter family protein [Arthrobacter sp. R-11]|uniref:threonine/serine ThrE exporter family protein n=1 Tax=Arthrobacter sp. R-11 TaxID=3404053 RepID=UPI003CEFE176
MTDRPEHQSDASNRPPTDGLPKTQPIRPSQVQQNLSARRMLRRLVQGENPPTAPLTIVDRLAGSPYANPTIQVGGVDASARKTVDFALHLAETMFRYGAGALEVETSIIAVTASLGLKYIEVDITNQSVGINYSPKDQTPVTLLRVVRSWTNNYAGLAQVHQLVTDIVAGGVGRDEAVRRLNDIIRRSKPFPRWMVTVAFGVFAAAFVGVLGGGPGASALAFVSNLLVSLLARQLGRWRTPDFYVTAACAFLVTFIAVMLRLAGADIAPSIVVAGGILLLLPTGRLVSSVQDAINGFPVTAAGRFLSTTLTFGAIVAGIAIALVLGDRLGSQAIDVTQTFPDAYPLWAQALLIGVAVLAIGVTEQTQLRLLFPTAAVGLVGFFVLWGASTLGLGSRLSPALSAVVIGLLARIVALRLGAPQLVVAVPAALILLPGLTIFRSMYVLTIEEADILAGFGGMLNAGAIVMATAAGIVLGDNLARPLTKNLASNERRRIRRRR